MPVVQDKGNWRSQFNSKAADIIANVLGQRVNYALRYYSHRHHFPNFKHPKDLSERLLAAMLSKDFLKYADYADKVKVREYVKSKGLEGILLKQFGAWEDASQISFDELPERFILKANNGCGGHFICTDKAKINISKVVDDMNATLKAASHLRKTEPHYCAIKPMILAEELMGDGHKLPTDYKFFCINGRCLFAFLCIDRENGTKFAIMDKEWKPLDYVYEHLLSKNIPAKPSNFDEMIKVSEQLAEDFEFVRVDLYNDNGNVKFGELTFSPEGGIMSYFKDETLELLGKEFEK